MFRDFGILWMFRGFGEVPKEIAHVRGLAMGTADPSSRLSSSRVTHSRAGTNADRRHHSVVLDASGSEFQIANDPPARSRSTTLREHELPDGESVWSRLGLLPHRRAMQMIGQEWPKIAADINGGHPSPLDLSRSSRRTRSTSS
jgi:hypothetical protein